MPHNVTNNRKKPEVCNMGENNACTPKGIQKRKVAAEVCSSVDDSSCSVKIEVALPGVNKQDIDLRLFNDSYFLTGSRENFDYVATGHFCCPVNIKDTDAKFDNGLLTVVLPFKDPLDGATKVHIQ
jgi:HSP20 family molecular chaperone IbpA